MRLPHLKHIATLGAAVGMMAVLGCSNLPTEPSPAAPASAPNGVANPRIIRIPVPDPPQTPEMPVPDPAEATTGASDGEPSGPVAVDPVPVKAEPVKLSGSAVIDGAQGGKVT